MKNKDFGFFQQHVEKIALGLGLAVLVGAGVTQFVLGEPNAIKLDNKPVVPGEIKDTVVKKANSLKSALARDSPVEAIDIPSYATAFSDLYTLPVGTDQRLAPIEAGGLAASLNEIVSPDYPELFLPSPPMVAETLAKTGHGVLDDDGSDLFYALQNIVGDQQPADFGYVSVSATFSFKDWQDKLTASSIPLDQRIDESLWGRRMSLTSVQLLRQEKNVVTGKWGPTQIVPLQPGQAAVLPEEQKELSLPEAQELEQWVLANQQDIRRTAFPQITNGPWTPPDISNRVFTAEEAQRQKDLQRSIKRLKRKLDKLTGNDTRDTATRRRPSNRASKTDGGGYGGDDGGSSRRPSSRNNDRERDRDARTREREAEKITEVQDELAQAETDLNQLLGIDEETLPARRSGGGGDPTGGYGGDYGGGYGGDPAGGYGNPAGGAYGGAKAQRRRGNAAATSDTVKVWAHDLTAKPGRTYRYKIVVSVLNPLYRFPRLDSEQYQENFHRIALAPTQLEIDAAEWAPSAEVTLDPDHYFFVISGSKDQKRASVEVWTVYNGLWRNKEFTEYPGDAIGGNANLKGVDTGGKGVPMLVGPILLDVDTVTAPSGRGSAVRALYLDPATGRIDARLVTEDKNSTKRQELENELDRQAEREDGRFSIAN